MKLKEVIDKINDNIFNSIPEVLFLRNDEYIQFFETLTEDVVKDFKKISGVDFVVGKNRRLYYSADEPVVFANIDSEFKIVDGGVEVYYIKVSYEQGLADLDISNIPMASYYSYRLNQIEALEKGLLNMQNEYLNMQERISQREFEIKRLKESLQGYIS